MTGSASPSGRSAVRATPARSSRSRGPSSARIRPRRVGPLALAQHRPAASTTASTDRQRHAPRHVSALGAAWPGAARCRACSPGSRATARPSGSTRTCAATGPLPSAAGADRARRELERPACAGAVAPASRPARKLAAVAARPGRPVVVGNGAEGEPVERQGPALLRRAPHLVLDGRRARRRGGRRRARRSSPSTATPASELAVARPRDRRARRRDRLDRGVTASASLAVPDGFVTGEETALVSFLERRPGQADLHAAAALRARRRRRARRSSRTSRRSRTSR